MQISSPIPHEKDEARSVSVTHIQNTTVQATAALPPPPSSAGILTATSSSSAFVQNNATITTTAGSGAASLTSSPYPQTPSSSSTSQILSPVSEGNTRPFHKQKRRHRLSRHYQESDILESATVTSNYHRSTVADKISDYEDIWGPDNSGLSTFKPQSKLVFTSAVDDLPPSKAVMNKSGSQEPSSSSSSSDLGVHHLRATAGTSSSTVTSPIETANTSRNRFGLILNTSGGNGTGVVVSSNNSSAGSTSLTADVKSPTEVSFVFTF